MHVLVSPLFRTCIAPLLPRCHCPAPLLPHLHSIEIKLLLGVTHHEHPGPVKTWLSTHIHSYTTHPVSLALSLCLSPVTSLFTVFLHLCSPPHPEICRCNVSNFLPSSSGLANSTRRGEERRHSDKRR